MCYYCSGWWTQWDSSYMDPLKHFQADVRWSWSLLKDCLGWTFRRPSHTADSWCLAGAVKQNAYMWPLQVTWTSHSLAGGLWKGMSPKQFLQKAGSKNTRAGKGYSCKHHSIISVILHWSKHSEDGGKINSGPHWGQVHFVEEHRRWEMFLQPFLENRIFHNLKIWDSG